MGSGRINGLGTDRISPICPISSGSSYQNHPQQGKYVPKKTFSNNQTEDSELVKTADDHTSVWA